MVSHDARRGDRRCHAQRRVQPRPTVVMRLAGCRQARRSDHHRLLASRRGVSCCRRAPVGSGRRRRPCRRGWAGMIRVVSGEFGGRKLVVPDGLYHPPDDRQGPPGGVQLARQRRRARRSRGRRPVCGLGRARNRSAVTRRRACVFVERDRAALHALRANIDASGLTNAHRRHTAMSSPGSRTARRRRRVRRSAVRIRGWDRLLEMLRCRTVVAEAGHEIEPRLDGQPRIATLRTDLGHPLERLA